MSKVFVVNKGAHDYTDATRFGELYFISDGALDKLDTSQMTRLCQSAFADSDPGDYIVLTSLASLCSVAAAVFAHKHGRVNLLIHNQGRYTAREIVLNGADNATDNGYRKNRARKAGANP